MGFGSTFGFWVEEKGDFGSLSWSSLMLKRHGIVITYIVRMVSSLILIRSEIGHLFRFRTFLLCLGVFLIFSCCSGSLTCSACTYGLNRVVSA